jgi:hypothetical protein
MSLGESFGVDLEILVGGFCFSAFSFTGVGSDVGSLGREQSPSGAWAKATSSLSLPSFRTSEDDDESSGSAGPAPGFILASTEDILGASCRRTSSMRRNLPSFCFSQSGFSLLDLLR